MVSTLVPHSLSVKSRLCPSYIELRDKKLSSMFENKQSLRKMDNLRLFPNC